MTSDNPGLIARVTTALRYAATGAMPTGWFGPGTPLAPQAPADVRGRQFDYPTVFNVNVRPRAGEKITFDALKRLATHPIVAMLIQRQKDKVSAIDWHIVPVKVEAAPGSVSAKTDPMIHTITEFLKSPDKEHDWIQWISGVLDQLMVIDAVTVYSAPTRAGDLYALQLLDGATIKPIIDLGGRRPMAPAPAFQQTLKGMPAVDYSTDELIYFPQVFRPDHVYGYSRVEQAYDLIDTAILRLKSQKGYFDHGNVGDGFFTAPTGWTPDMVKGLETQWNAMMQGDPGGRRNLPMLPDGVNFHETKTGMLSDQFDEFLIRLLCFPFGVAPQPFMKQTGLGHGSADTAHDAAEEGGIAPLMQYVSRLMTLIIAKWFQRPDLEFQFVEDREFDPVLKAKIEDQRLRNGTLTINQVLDRNGEAPVEGGDTPLLFTGTAWVTLDSILNPPPPPEPIAPIAPIAPGEGDAAAPPPHEPVAPIVPGGGDGGDNGEKTPPPSALKKSADPAAQLHLKVVIASYLAGKAKTVGDTLFGKMVKAAMDDPNPRLEASLDDIDWSWDDLPKLVEPFLTSIAVAAGMDAVDDLGSDLFDAETLKRVSARATAYARDRSAELVGMKWDGDTLIANPDAAWSISETTRSQINKLITDAMAEGQSNDQLRKAIVESAAFSSDRADTIARTETAVADIRGAAASWIESGVVHSAQFDASPDCCEDCQAEDGTIVPLAEPDDLDLPHPNCFPAETLVLAPDVTAAFCRPYEGNLVIIHTASGKQLSCTPNHPILTPGGWVPARLLDVGGHVISSRVGDWVAGAGIADGQRVGNDAKDVPSRIHDVAEAFGRSRQVSAMEVPVSAPDFHGDGESSKVAIVWADRLLVDRANAARGEHLAEGDLLLADMDTLRHDGASVLDLGLQMVGSASGGFVGAGDLSPSSIGIHPLPFQGFGGGAAPDRHPAINKHVANSGATDTELVRDSLFGEAREVTGNGSGTVERGTAPELASRLAQVLADRSLRETGLDADLTDLLAGGVFADEVVDLSLRRYENHIYNIQTVSGAFVAQGIVTHNCRCSWSAVLDDEGGATDSQGDDEND